MRIWFYLWFLTQEIFLMWSSTMYFYIHQDFLHKVVLLWFITYHRYIKPRNLVQEKCPVSFIHCEQLISDL